ncbi:MAG TPA: DUF2914 domain-containing protein [Chromatiales bacterium]|nr:DUF2914 domain-containing protein [Chromatiales bacterium]
MNASLLSQALLGGALLLAAGPAGAAAGARPAIAQAPRDPVARSQFTRAIRDREPVGDVVTLPNSVDHVYYFSEIRGMTGKTIVHRWMYHGRVMAEVRFPIGGPRWRVYSRKTLEPKQLGRWTVVVTNGSGWPLHAEMFDYVAATPPAHPAPAAVRRTAPPVATPAASKTPPADQDN